MALKTVEDQLSGVFKGLPALPENAKESLVKAWPILALIAGLVQLFVAWGLWSIVSRVSKVNEVYNSLSVYYTGMRMGLSSMDKTILYLGIIILAINAVILLMAYPQLQKRARKGWELVFLAALINVAFAVVELFAVDRGLGNFIFSLLGSAIAFYLLFQVKDKYKT